MTAGIRRRGAALILVVVVIAALLAIAAPFVVSMRLHEKSSKGFSASIEARQLADAGRNQAVAHVMRSHPDEERRARVAQNDLGSDPEGWDTHDEVQRFQLQPLTGLHTLETSSATDTMVSVEVRDVRGRIDLNTAGPIALSNLLGVTVTTEELPWAHKRGQRILVEDISPFVNKDDNDPNTIDGLVSLNGELIVYRYIDRNRRSLEGLTRHLFFTNLQGPGSNKKGVPHRRPHPAGSLLQDGRGWKLMWDPLWRYVGTDREGRLARFDNTAAIRRTTDWEFGTVLTALFLTYRWGVNLKVLQRWGLTKKKIQLAGLVRGFLDREEPDHSEETEKERQTRRVAERELRSWGAKSYVIDALERRRRSKGIVPAWQQLKALSAEARKQRIEELTNEIRKERDELKKAERELRRWGVGDDVIAALRQYGGDDGVVRVHKQLAAMSPENRARRLEGLSKGREKRKERLKENEGWLRKVAPVQLKTMEDIRKTAPYLEAIGRVELEERVRPFVTTDAPPEGAAWSSPQTVNHEVRFRPYSNSSVFRISDTRRFRRWSMVRITPIPGRGAPNNVAEYRVCYGAAQDRVWVFPQLDYDYQANQIEISCRQPRPVNVNTASRQVLRAVLTGLQSATGQKGRARGGQAPNFVTPLEAAAVAAAIVERTKTGPITDPITFRAEVLLPLRQEDKIDDHDVDAIFRNAVDPNDPMLSRSTVPFCYRSGDVYAIRATGVVNDPAGSEVARHTFREVVRVAPPRNLVWHIDSQADFSDRIYLAGRSRRVRGLGGRRDVRLRYRDSSAFLTLPGRWSNLIQTRPSFLGPYSATPLVFPSRSHAPGQGDILPLLAREPDQSTGTTPQPNWAATSGGPTPGGLAPNNPQRWDGQLEGADLGSLSLSSSQTPTRWYRTEAGVGRSTLGPGSIRGWFRFDTIPGAGVKAFLFDGGEADTIDRISLYLEGDRRLVLSVHDEAMDEIESSQVGLTSRPVQVVYDATRPFQRGKWYHIAAFFKGADRGDLALAVDGQFVGQDTLGSRLSAAIDPWTTSIALEDASSFPPQGWVRVGSSRWIASPRPDDRGIWGTGFDANQRCEVLYYSRKSGDTLIVDSEPTWVPPANATVTRVRDQDDNNATISGIPTDARRPKRGSGHRYRYDYTVPRANNPNRTNRANHHENYGYAHDRGTLVVPYGYSSWVKNEAAGAAGQPGFQDRVRVGGATLRQALPRNMPYTLLYKPVAYNRLDPFPQVIAATDTEIPVFWVEGFSQERPVRAVHPDDQPPAAQTLKGGFPPFGILRIGGNERVFYGGIDLRNGRFINCIRGIEGTTAAAHTMFEPVVLESIQVSDFSDYPQRAAVTEPRVYLSLCWMTPLANGGQTEWLSYQNVADQALAGRGLVMIPPRDDFNAQQRGAPGAEWIRDALNDMRRQGTLNGLNPGMRTIVLPLQVPNPPPPNLPNWQQEQQRWLTSNPGGLPWKEVLKRQEPSVVGRTSVVLQMNNGRNRRFGMPSAYETGSRACKGTSKPPHQTGHPSSTKVVPTFTLRLADGLNRGNWGFNMWSAECGSGDVVTLTDDQTAAPQRAEYRVAHSALSLPGQSAITGGSIPQGAIKGALRRMGVQNVVSAPPGDQTLGWLVSFDDFTAREYLGTENARLARWPVGNLRSLPNLVFGQARLPTATSPTVADAPGTLRGKVDDFVVTQLDENPNSRVTNLYGGFDDTATSASPVRVNFNTWRRGNLLRADGELIAVVDAAQASPPSGTRGTHSNLTLMRGALGSQAAPVSRETFLWRLTWPPIAIASAGAGGSNGFGGGRNIFVVVRQPQGDFRFRQGVDGGYLRVYGQNGQDKGVLPYIQLQNIRGARGLRGFVRPANRWGAGVYTGAFGTNPDGTTPCRPAPNDLLVDMPFRHHDRYQDGARTNNDRLFVDSAQGLFFQASRELPGAFIHRIEWDEHLPDPACEVKIAVRLDGAPAWDSLPATGPRQKFRLYLFDDPREANEILLRANRVELRVYLTFKRGAFQSDAWKDGPLVGGIRIHYRQPTQSLRREERTD